MCAHMHPWVAPCMDRDIVWRASPSAARTRAWPRRQIYKDWHVPLIVARPCRRGMRLSHHSLGVGSRPLQASIAASCRPHAAAATVSAKGVSDIATKIRYICHVLEEPCLRADETEDASAGPTEC